MNWRTLGGQNIEPLSDPQYEVLFNGMLKKERLLDMIQNFILVQEFLEPDNDLAGKKIGHKKSTIKFLAVYHQYFAVKKLVLYTKEEILENGDSQIRVIWQAKGSVKSYSIVIYAAGLVQELNNPTIMIITGRNDLDNQLFDTF